MWKSTILLKAIEYIKLGVALDMGRDEIVEMLAECLDAMFEFKLDTLEARDKEAWMYVIDKLIDIYQKRKVKKHSTILERIETFQQKQTSASAQSRYTR